MATSEYYENFATAMNYMKEEYTGGSVIGLKRGDSGLEMEQIDPAGFSSVDVEDA